MNGNAVRKLYFGIAIQYIWKKFTDKGLIKIKPGIICLVMMISMMLSGCDKMESGVLEKTEQADVWAISEGFALAKDGIVYQRDSLLHFADFSSGQNIILCNKPNCKHIPYDRVDNPDPYCEAALPFDSALTCSFIYQDVLYTFTTDAKTTTVYQRDADGSGWEKSMEIPYPFFYGNIKAEQGKAYLIACEVITDEKTAAVEQYPFILEADLLDHTYTRLSDVKHYYNGSISLASPGDGFLYYQYYYLDDIYKDYDTDKMTGLTEEDYSREIYRINPAESSEERILGKEEYTGYSYAGAFQGRIYLYKDNVIIEADGTDKEEIILWKGTDEAVNSASVYNDILLFSTGVWGAEKRYAYKISTDTLQTIKRPANESYPVLYANGIVLFMNADDSLCYKAISMDKYLEGSTDYLVEY